MEPQNPFKPIELDPRAYRFFPSDKQQKTAFNKDGKRHFYYGHIQHDEFEKEKLQQFQNYLETNNLPLNVEFWTEQRCVLFLSAYRFKIKETYEAMLEHQKFRAEYIGPEREKVLFDPVSDLISSGFFYPCGRDRHFRPILVYNLFRVDHKDYEKGLKATIFVHQRIIETFFLPGQVENWNVIYDLGGMGFTDIPIGVVKKMLGIMEKNYGGRLNRLWVVNTSFAVNLSWKIVSAFLDKVTLEKIKLTSKNTEKSLFNECDPSQIEKKYGGTQPNRTKYWPFEIPAGVFDTERLITDEEYEKMLKDGALKNNKIDPKYT